MAFEAVVDSLSLGLFRHCTAKLVTPLFEHTFLTHLCKITTCAQIFSSLISSLAQGVTYVKDLPQRLLCSNKAELKIQTCKP